MNEMILKVTVPENLVGQCFQHGLADMLDRCKIEVMETAHGGCCKSEEKNATQEKVAPRKFIKFNCAECNRRNFANIDEVDKKYNIKCLECSTEYSFSNMELVKSGWDCNDCGRSNYYFTPYIEGMEIQVDECKCRNKCIMAFDNSAGMFVSRKVLMPWEKSETVIF